MLLAACAPSPQNQIVGKWEVEGAPLQMIAEFDKDGTAHMTMLGQTLQGTYKVNGENELEWTMGGQTTKAKFNVAENELQLTTAANQTIKYKRK